ncbi:U-scoloptoxin(19)-Tl1a-like [Prorops nasuta]|uniref:U-scoloptoxin(19)-Tl1a-like n=1 Tax=Prorops nasuta TaxID=863751 RepID=UPI0034CDF979
MSQLSAVSLFCLLAILAVSLHSSTSLSLCPKENCVKNGQCELSNKEGLCSNPSEICCGIVKSEFRTHCRHFGGECMSRCAQALQRDVVDCPAGETCCILV